MLALRRWSAILLAVLAGMLLLGGGPAQAAAPSLDLSTRSDRTGDVAGGLDITSLSFGQVDTQLQLAIETKEPWSASDLSVGGPRQLCVEISYGPRETLRKLICVGSLAGEAGIQWADVQPDGAPGPVQTTAAFVTRPEKNSLYAQFPPAAVGLPTGTFRWRIISRWTDEATCAAGRPACVDLAPNRGALLARAGLLVQPRCYGGAARATRAGCDNPELARTSLPTPADAELIANAFCRPEAFAGAARPCTFGWLAADEEPKIALVGDSHAGHWRGAIEVVADAKRWGAVSMTRSGCPFTPRPTFQTPEKNAACAEHFQGVKAWLAAHPTVSTVYISSHALPDDGQRGRDYKLGWAELPPSVRSIIVIRDTPKMPSSVATCVDRAVAAGEAPGTACARKRTRGTLPVDPEANAARATSQERVHFIDLTKYMCSSTQCFPVVGGALVHKDGEHLTRPFATSLGPYVLRASERYLR